MGKLDGKVAIVTGSNSGIGRAIAINYAQEGAQVVVNYSRNEAEAKIVQELIEKNGGTCLVIQADVSKYQQCQSLIQQSIDYFGHLDILVNNAGIARQGPFLEATEEDFDRVIGVNLRGTFFCTQLAARIMIQQGKGGRIINVSSVHEDLAMPQNVPYCCSKGGIRMLMRTICLELAPYQITVNNIGPGAISTPINAETEANPEELAALLQEIPLHRMGQPEEVAGLALYLASDAASYVTGSSFFIDGGLMQNAGSL